MYCLCSRRVLGKIMETPSDKVVVPTLQIDPEGILEFDKDESVANLDLKNALDLIVMFKVKTTSPASFTVRPSQGILSAGAHISVAVRLHEQVQSQGNRNWSKDKFKVETLSVKDNDYDSNQPFDFLWKRALEEGQKKTESRIIRCRFSQKNMSPKNINNNNNNKKKGLPDQSVEEKPKPLAPEEKTTSVAKTPDENVKTFDIKHNSRTSENYPTKSTLSNDVKTNSELQRLRKENRILKLSLAVTVAVFLLWIYLVAFADFKS